MTYEELVRKFGKPAADRSYAAAHATKTAICQMIYNRMEITDMDQMTPDGPYMEV